MRFSNKNRVAVIVYTQENVREILDLGLCSFFNVKILA